MNKFPTFVERTKGEEKRGLEEELKKKSRKFRFDIVYSRETFFQAHLRHKMDRFYSLPE